MINDLIADSITRIRNASLRKLEVCTLNFSNTVNSILEVFKTHQYIKDFKIIEEGNKKFIKVVLNYKDDGSSVISELVRVSKPGRRVYKKSEELKSYKNGHGLFIVSTNKGIIANNDAYKENIGGEVLCSIW